jgi:hypothetical protein
MRSSLALLEGNNTAYLQPCLSSIVHRSSFKEKITMSSLENIFNQFNNVKLSETYDREDDFPSIEGTHLVIITQVKQRKSVKTQGKHFFIVEFEVQQTSCPDVVKVGKRYTWMVDMLRSFGSGETFRAVGVEDTKKFIAAAAGLHPASEEAGNINSALLEKVWGPEQPFAGEEVIARTDVRPTEKGSSWTRFIWSPVGSEVSEISSHEEAQEQVLDA